MKNLLALLCVGALAGAGYQFGPPSVQRPMLGPVDLDAGAGAADAWTAPDACTPYQPSLMFKFDENASNSTVGNSGGGGGSYNLYEGTSNPVPQIYTSTKHVSGKLSGAFSGFYNWSRDSQGTWVHQNHPYPLTTDGAGSVLFMGWLKTADISTEHGFVLSQAWECNDYIWYIEPMFNVRASETGKVNLLVDNSVVGMNVDGNGPVITSTWRHVAIYWRHDGTPHRERAAVWQDGVWIGQATSLAAQGHIGASINRHEGMYCSEALSALTCGGHCFDYNTSYGARQNFEGGMDNLRLFVDQVPDFNTANALVLDDYAAGSGNAAPTLCTHRDGGVYDARDATQADTNDAAPPLNCTLRVLCTAHTGQQCNYSGYKLHDLRCADGAVGCESSPPGDWDLCPMGYGECVAGDPPEVCGAYGISAQSCGATCRQPACYNTGCCSENCAEFCMWLKARGCDLGCGSCT